MAKSSDCCHWISFVTFLSISGEAHALIAENVKERVAKKRDFNNIRTTLEEVAEFDYRPLKCKKTYPLVVLRKNLTVEKAYLSPFDDISCFFHIGRTLPFIDSQFYISSSETKTTVGLTVNMTFAT